MKKAAEVGCEYFYLFDNGRWEYGAGKCHAPTERPRTGVASHDLSHIPYPVTASSLAIPDCAIPLLQHDYLEKEKRASAHSSFPSSGSFQLSEGGAVLLSGIEGFESAISAISKRAEIGRI